LYRKFVFDLSQNILNSEKQFKVGPIFMKHCIWKVYFQNALYPILCFWENFKKRKTILKRLFVS